MGSLIEQDMPSLYGGVSRQPASVRLTSQHEDAINVSFSVVNGGFEKRDPAEFIATLDGISASKEWVAHFIDRDEAEQYILLVSDEGDIKAFDASDGTEKTVTVDSGKATEIAAYLSTGSVHPAQGLAFVTIVDTTVVTNRNVATAMVAAPDPAPTLDGSVEIFSDLADETPSDEDIYEVTGGASALDNYFVQYSSSDTQWTEVPDPRISNDFDPDTMPIQIVRESDGTFTVSQIAWDGRRAGGADTVPEPRFIGSPIKDVIYYRDRLGFLANNNVFFSQVSDYFNLWPDKAIEVLDSDPIDTAASSSRGVPLLKWGLPFSKTLFLTADKAQFQHSGSTILTPATAPIDETTTYSTTNKCRPVTMGSELYFASELAGNSMVYEYYFDQDTLSNVADDVSKHATGYVPASIERMVASPAAESLFLLAGTERRDVYAYQVYWDDDRKVMSAWGRWRFDGSMIDIGALGDQLYMVARRGDDVLLLKVNPSETDTDAGWHFKVDQKVALTGTHDSGTTSWELPYAHNGTAVGLLSSDFDNAGRQLALTYDEDGVTVSASGDWSGGDVVFGFTYESRVRLSRQYARDPQTQKSQLQGRTQLKRLLVNYSDTGYFEVHVTPQGRPTRVFKMTGRNVGVLNNIIGAITLSTGQLSVGVKSKADRVDIDIVSSSYLPMVIPSASWFGFYSNIVRSG